MQQQLNQQEQIGCQQTMQQQMVLCPVRFVYETQILVPPGDQIQPNQTFFINPQNPPPWVQNRQIQNQVVYVQQLPNNILSSTQQHMDQNQLYLQQNFGNYQIQQPMLTQNQDMRALTNIVPNIVQNIQPNPSERNVVQNLPNPSQIQANGMIQNQISLNRQMPNQSIETQRQYMRPQMTQQITRPIMTMNQIQNMQLQQTVPNMQNMLQQVNFGQTFVPNVGHPRPIQNMSAQRNVQPGNNTPNPINMPNVQPVTKVRDVTPIDMNKTVNNNIASGIPVANVIGNANARNFVPNYTYRPIQPRPQIRHSSTQVQPKPIQNPPMYVSKNNSQNIVPTNTFMSNTDNVNRKRKSESPDEIHKKIAVTATPHYNVSPSITVTKLSNEIGINTSPVHKMDSKIILTHNSMLQINPNSPQIVKIVDSPQNNPINENIDVNSVYNKVVLTDKDKLVRNTVFTQARGRVLHDKSITNDVKPQIAELVPTDDVKEIPETKTTELTVLNNVITESKTTDSTALKVIDNITSESKAEIKIEDKQNTEEDSGIKDIKEEGKVVDDVKEESSEDINRIILKNDRDTILTHVVDGYVIQEAGFAFPIRKPLKEKTLHTNTQLDERAAKCSTVDSVKIPIELPLLPLHYLHLDNNQHVENEKNAESDEKDTPFSRLLHTTVKSWTVEDLTKHLSKYDWKETVSRLQEHEIDGESLFLVSKSQLITIGVKEDHADAICEFVKS